MLVSSPMLLFVARCDQYDRQGKPVSLRSARRQPGAFEHEERSRARSGSTPATLRPPGATARPCIPASAKKVADYFGVQVTDLIAPDAKAAA